MLNCIFVQKWKWLLDAASNAAEDNCIILPLVLGSHGMMRISRKILAPGSDNKDETYLYDLVNVEQQSIVNVHSIRISRPRRHWLKSSKHPTTDIMETAESPLNVKALL